jgi:hypothetical protein
MAIRSRSAFVLIRNLRQEGVYAREFLLHFGHQRRQSFGVRLLCQRLDLPKQAHQSRCAECSCRAGGAMGEHFDVGRA